MVIFHGFLYVSQSYYTTKPWFSQAPLMVPVFTEVWHQQLSVSEQDLLAAANNQGRVRDAI